MPKRRGFLKKEADEWKKQLLKGIDDCVFIERSDLKLAKEIVSNFGKKQNVTIQQIMDQCNNSAEFARFLAHLVFKLREIENVPSLHNIHEMIRALDAYKKTSKQFLSRLNNPLLIPFFNVNKLPKKLRGRRRLFERSQIPVDTIGEIDNYRELMIYIVTQAETFLPKIEKIRSLGKPRGKSPKNSSKIKVLYLCDSMIETSITVFGKVNIKLIEYVLNNESVTKITGSTIEESTIRRGIK